MSGLWNSNSSDPSTPSPTPKFDPQVLMNNAAAVPLHSQAPHIRGVGWTLKTALLLFGRVLSWTPGRDVSPGKSLSVSPAMGLHLDMVYRSYFLWHSCARSNHPHTHTQTYKHTFTCHMFTDVSA